MQATNFEYLRSAAQKYGNRYFVNEFDAFVEQATQDQLRELADAYESIEVREDAPRISQFVRNNWTSKPGVDEADTQFAQQLGQLLTLFDYLARSDIAPFSSGHVKFIDEVKTPEWSAIPAELEYLIDCAEQYGNVSTEQEMLDLLDRLPESEMELLAALAEKIRLNKHFEIINDWVNKHGGSEEAWRIYALLGILDHADLRVE